VIRNALHKRAFLCVSELLHHLKNSCGSVVAVGRQVAASVSRTEYRFFCFKSFVFGDTSYKLVGSVSVVPNLAQNESMLIFS
jgi:hypothetical protein